MNRIFLRGWILVAMFALFSAGHVFAQEDVDRRLAELERQVELLREQLAARDSALVADLLRQIDAITREIEQLKLGQEVVSEAEEGVFGFGPAASKVYRVGRGVSIGGYGEMLYENFAGEREDGLPSGASNRIDFLRAIVYVGYKFDDRFLFNSEIELEHAATGNAGSVSVEFAYIDWLASDHVGFRGGLVLIPMGFLNELHEPPTFLAARRPATETQIIPTTWRENGLGAFGEAGPFAYRAYIVNGLDAIGGGSSNASGFSASGLRGGRQKGSKAVAETFGVVGRLDYVGTLGLTLGGSIYGGRSGQGNRVDPADQMSERIDAFTLITEGHVDYRAHGLQLRGLIAYSSVDDAALINQRKGLSGDESVGEKLLGWYVEGGYDVLRSVNTRHSLIPFVRYEWLNPQQSVPTGFAANPALERRIITLGASWRPRTQVAIKFDYEFHSNEAGAGVNQLSAALGYLF